MCWDSGSHADYKAGEPARKESIEDQKRQYLIQDINAMFGYYDEAGKPSQDWYQYERNDYFPGYGKEKDDYEGRLKEAAVPGVTWDSDYRRTVHDEGKYNSALDRWSNENATAQQEAEANKKFRQEQYDQLLHDTVAYYTNQLDRQSEDAGRQQKFSAARRGVSGGSSDIDQKDRLLEEYTLGNLNVANKGQGAVNDLRGADEAARLDLIARVNSGMDADSAISAATTAIANALDSAKSDSVSTGLGQQFSNYAQYYNQPQTTGAGHTGGSGGTYVTNRPRYQGNVRNI